jgi:hypothetical protein
MYNYKFLQEVLWAGAVAVGITLLTVLVTFDPEQVTDWQTWAVGLGGGAVRAFAAAVLAQLRPS